MGTLLRHRSYAFYHRPVEPPWERGFGRLTYLPLVAAVVLRLASSPTADLSYLVLAGYAALGRPHAIRAFIVSWLFTLMNPGFSPDGALGGAGRYGVLIASIISAVAYKPAVRRHSDSFISGTFILGAFFIVHSLLFSSVVDVSLLKCISWLLTMVVCLSAWLGFSDWQRERVGDELFWILVATLVFSLPLFVTPMGFLANGTGFQGIFNQPQAFGVTMALLASWSVTRFLSQRQPSWVLVGIMGASVFGILLSEARVAGLAMFGGVLGSLGLTMLVGGRRVLNVMPGLRSWRVWSMVCLAVAAMIVFLPKIVSLIDHYLTKSGRADVAGLTDAYNASRGVLMQPMLANIWNYPFTGIGFGIGSDPMAMEIVRDPILGLPLSAAVEKGVTPIAILEETGIFGLVLVLLWVVRLVQVAARGGVVPLAVCLTALLVNLAEASMFSAGGQGLLAMMLLAWSYSCGSANQSEASRRPGRSSAVRGPAPLEHCAGGFGPRSDYPGARTLPGAGYRRESWRP
ncbi:O-antigen ligase family protein [Ancylobacter sp. FA202]|uniref:O-antigen ligase family protein n=1 Tax=Ancylobacter sp. FA202 TaxID=1111106 RepID=UPI0003827683|nr:O-antigen ligase family protein [Ancylobacter sp. FA202]